MGDMGSVLEVSSDRRYGPMKWVQGLDQSLELGVKQGCNITLRYRGLLAETCYDFV